MASNTSDSKYRKIFSALIGITALIVLLQGVWAGVFLQHDGARDAASKWIDLHATGSHISAFLAFVAAVLAVVKLRSRKDLLIGAISFFVALIVESYIGGRIRDNGNYSLTVVHVPLAMGIMALVVWLSLRASRGHAVQS